MSNTLSVTEAFESAEEFLGPALKRDEIHKNRGGTLIELLNRDVKTQDVDIELARDVVLGKAVSLLKDIHNAFSRPQSDDLSLAAIDANEAALEDAKRRKVLHALLDLISLEGIYPGLSPGIGVPLEKRVISALPTGVVAKKAPFSEGDTSKLSALLKTILDAVLEIIFDGHPGIQPIVLGRILSDIICGLAELVFQSRILGDEEKTAYADAFERLLDETPTATLLPTLSAFLRPDAAPWFQRLSSTRISRVPLRKDGVVQTIFFVAAQLAPSLGHDGQQLSSSGPPITVQAIMHISKLLSSVPEGMEPTAYFLNIGPQLLALIDGDDPDLKRTAAYIVGSGILGKKAFGAPGAIGHRIFVEPLFKALTAELDDSTRVWLAHSTEQNMPQVDENNRRLTSLVTGAELLRAVERLGVLTLQHPNPGLVRRLIHPMLIPLWGLSRFAHESQNKPWHDRCFRLLQTYFSVSTGFQSFKKIIDNLLWRGDASWTYGLDQSGEIFLQKQNDALFDVVHLMQSLEASADELIQLLKCDPQLEERTGDVFLYVSEQWLSPTLEPKKLNTMITLPHNENDSEQMTRKLVSAKLTERLLEDFKDTLSRRPLRVLELVQQLLASERIRVTDKRNQRPSRTGSVSLETLANIVDDAAEDPPTDEQDQDSTDSMSAAFSLLSTILGSPDFSLSSSLQPVLQRIKSLLDSLIPHLPVSLAKPGTTASMLLEIQLSNTNEQMEPQPATMPRLSDFEIHRQVLLKIGSPMPPVQAEGLSQLSMLITKSSPVLDIPSTVNLLLSMITEQDAGRPANEEFLYLRAIGLVGVLAAKHPRTVVKSLVDRYADRDEQSSVDQRLKIGECLLRTVQDLGYALVGEHARTIGEGMISVAGRRGRKPQAHKSRRSQVEKERRLREREQKESAMPSVWKIASLIPEPDKSTESTSSPIDEADSNDSENEVSDQAAQSANIISAWAAGSSLDQEPDDLRIRASALSILGTAIQTNLLALGPRIATSAIDLALSILSLEPGPESAILRRACVILLLDLIKAIDNVRETRAANKLGFGFSFIDTASSSSTIPEASPSGPTTIGNIPSILRTLSFVENKETDSVVRGHIRVLMESFEAWMEKSLLWGIRAQDRQDNGPRLTLGGRIAGLNIDPLAGVSQPGGKQAVIEEIE